MLSVALFAAIPSKLLTQPPPRTRRGFLELTELLGFLLIALALLFFVLAYIMFFAGKVENGIVCASIGLVLLVWGGKAFKGLFPGA